ncbi:uncharacterized protein HaLaN_05008, partial [Haematococcus lacustris]
MSDSYDTASRDSLLNVVLDKLQKSGKTAIVGRVIFVARFIRREANVDHFTEFFPKLFDKFHQDGETTGILLCYPTCCVHVLEAKTSVIMSILRDMLAAGSQEHRLAEARYSRSRLESAGPSRAGVVACRGPIRGGVEPADGEDRAASAGRRQAAHLTGHSCVLPAHTGPGRIVKSASELNASMRKLGGTLTDLTESELKRRLAAMDQYCEDLPAPELLMSLVPAEDAPTVEEFLDIFDAPVTVELDSEKVWPMPSMLKAWN